MEPFGVSLIEWRAPEYVACQDHRYSNRTTKFGFPLIPRLADYRAYIQSGPAMSMPISAPYDVAILPVGKAELPFGSLERLTIAYRPSSSVTHEAVQ